MAGIARCIATLLAAILGLPAAAADYRVDGNRLTISGAFYSDREFDRFAGYVRENPAVDTIVMKDFSGGMNMSGFLNFTKFIRDRKLATEVDGPCMSACALAFLGGVRRGLAPTADPRSSFVAFHGIYSMGGKLYEPYEGTFVAALRRYTGGRMSEAVARRAFALPQNGLLMFFDAKRGKGRNGLSVLLCRDIRKSETCTAVRDLDALSAGVFTH